MFGRFSTGCSTFWKPAANGATCRETSRRAARATTICSCGPGTEPWSASITNSTGASASSKAGRPARPPPWSTARVSARRKRGPASDPVGYDAGKKIKGVKYHILVDTLGLLLSVVVHHAGVQDRDGTALVLDKKTRSLFPFIRVVFADGGYQVNVAAATVSETGGWKLAIVKRSDQAKGFVVLPRRWLVERTLAWLTRCRRPVRHYEQYLHTSVAFIHLAMIRLRADWLGNNLSRQTLRLKLAAAGQTTPAGPAPSIPHAARRHHRGASCETKMDKRTG